MYYDELTDQTKEYDFLEIGKKMRQLLIKEGIITPAFQPNESIYYDGIAVSYEERFPILEVPVNYRIHYDIFYGENSSFSASVGIPRKKLVISDMECRRIAADCGRATGMTVSFEGRHTSDKYIGIFHVINSVFGKHVMDIDEMQQYLHDVRCIVADIAFKLFEKQSGLYVTGQCDSHATIAKFEQVNSMADDDKVLIERDYFKDYNYDPSDTINIADTLDITELLYTAELSTDKS